MSEENRQRFQTEEDALEDTALDEYPLPDSSIASGTLAEVDCARKDLLAMYAGRACELVKEATIYAILPDNSLDMPRFAEQIRLYPPDTLFAVSRQEWQNSMVFHDMVNARMSRQMERERAFLRHKGDCYAIYQLHIVDKPMSLEAARRSGLSPRLCGYDLIYTATLPQGSGLEELRRKFTQQLPIDCVYQTLPSGKIPDVSNIIAIKKDGKLETWYVDQLAYSQLTGMFEQIPLYGTDGQGHQQPLPYEIPLYRQTGQYALERGELPAYFASHNANIACRDAIDRAIAEHYHVAENLHGGTLDIPGAIRQVREEFGYERMLYVLACSIRQKSWDGRISRENIHWAESISVIADIVPPNTREDRNLHFLIDYTHSCQLDAFTKAARRDYDLHRPLSGEEIAGEAERIFNELNTMKETNGPGYQDFVVEVSPDFVLRANADDLRILSSMMPFQSFELTAMREFYSSGFFAKIAGNEKRGSRLHLRPPSVRRRWLTAKAQNEKAAKPQKENPARKRRQTR